MKLSRFFKKDYHYDRNPAVLPITRAGTMEMLTQVTRIKCDKERDLKSIREFIMAARQQGVGVYMSLRAVKGKEHVLRKTKNMLKSLGLRELSARKARTNRKVNCFVEIPDEYGFCDELNIAAKILGTLHPLGTMAVVSYEVGNVNYAEMLPYFGDCKTLVVGAKIPGLHSDNNKELMAGCPANTCALWQLHALNKYAHPFAPVANRIGMEEPSTIANIQKDWLESYGVFLDAKLVECPGIVWKEHTDAERKAAHEKKMKSKAARTEKTLLLQAASHCLGHVLLRRKHSQVWAGRFASGLEKIKAKAPRLYSMGSKLYHRSKGKTLGIARKLGLLPHYHHTLVPPWSLGMPFDPLTGKQFRVWRMGTPPPEGV